MTRNFKDPVHLLYCVYFHKKYKDLSMVFLVGFYFLNILDANIDAHLLDFNVDENLSFQPYFENDAIFNQNLGIKLKITL